jgi:undecaprenyl-phosphate 4-deoxy-4-formamido-L-arabinose transferase
MAHTLISCVIPCYKSAQTISGVVEEINLTFEAHGGPYEHEIILVNDGSPDGGATIARLRELAAADDRIVVVNLARNFGQHAALMAGLAQVHGDIVVCLDDDGQTPADEMFKLIDKVQQEHFDIAYAAYGHKQHAAWRNLGSRFNTWCNHRFMGIPKDLQDNSYFACKRYVVDNALNYTNPYPFVEGLLFQSVETYCNVPVNHRSREVGESGYTLHKLISLWLNGFTAFSVVPLRAASVLGFLFALFGFIFAIVVVVQKLTVPGIDDGWSSQMAALMFIGGLIMIILGLMGEYVGRIYISLNRIPQYVVRSTIDQRPADDAATNDANVPSADEGSLHA